METQPQPTGVSLQRNRVIPIVRAALREDVGPRDITTSALILKAQIAKAQIVVRQEGVVAGLRVAEWTFAAMDPRIRFKPLVCDGQKVYPDKAIAFLEGPARSILMAERVALNFLGRMSGIATLTSAFVEQVKGTCAQICDTRKTTPTLRILERYAVAVGGGVNHRMGLFDRILIKENHLKLLPSVSRAQAPSPIEQAVARIRSHLGKGCVIEVEVTNLKEFRQALSAQAQIVLLDNMGLSQIEEAVRLRDAFARSRNGYRALLEVSGGMTLKVVRSIAQLGVDRISVGALTHSACVLDVALEVF